MKQGEQENFVDTEEAIEDMIEMCFGNSGDEEEQEEMKTIEDIQKRHKQNDHNSHKKFFWILKDIAHGNCSLTPTDQPEFRMPTWGAIIYSSADIVLSQINLSKIKIVVGVYGVIE